MSITEEKARQNELPGFFESKTVIFMRRPEFLPGSLQDSQRHLS